MPYFRFDRSGFGIGVSAGKTSGPALPKGQTVFAIALTAKAISETALELARNTCRNLDQGCRLNRSN
jgi:hypothetical protein